MFIFERKFSVLNFNGFHAISSITWRLLVTVLTPHSSLTSSFVPSLAAIFFIGMYLEPKMRHLRTKFFVQTCGQIQTEILIFCLFSRRAWKKTVDIVLLSIVKFVIRYGFFETVFYFFNVSRFLFFQAVFELCIVVENLDI